jgi:hypothetical protein
MTDDINTYTFNYKDEAEKALHEPIQGLNKLQLTEVHLTPASDKGAAPQVDILQKIGTQRISDKRLSKLFNKHFSSSSSSVLIPLNRFFRSANYVMVLNNEERLTRMMGENNKQALFLFTLYHEMGHALVPDGLRSKLVFTMPGEDAGAPNQYPFGEGAADAYAAIRLFQRFGAQAKPLLSLISWLRAYMSDTTHMTTTVLDKIIADSTAQNFFTDLSPQAAIDRAAAYAKALTPKPGMLEAFQKIYKNNQTMPDVIKASLSPSSDDFSFYIGAKMAQPQLHDGLIRKDKLLQWDDSKIAAFNAAINERADKNRLSPAQKDDATPTLKETLPIFLPPGQKKVVLN